MLETFLCSSPISHNEIFSRVDFSRETLIISDLRTKKEIQKKLLQKNGFFLENSVLRASDFWKVCLQRVSPEKRIISFDRAHLLVRGLLNKEKEKFELNESSSSTVLSLLQQMAPLFLSEVDLSTFDEWLETQMELRSRLAPWIPIIERVMEVFQEKNLILQEWIPRYLQTQSLDECWNRPLWVDLGGELKMSEAEVFQMLSKQLKVRILAPNPTWKKKYFELLRPYEEIPARSQNFSEASIRQSSNIRTIKLSGRLAEVKNATAQIRRWIDEGVSPHQIAVIAADIETYWPVLEMYFRNEGLPSQKRKVVRSLDLPSVMRWLALLRTRSQHLSSADLEVALFSPLSLEENQDLLFQSEKFSSLYHNIYSVEDLSREESLQSWLQPLLSREKELSLHEFLNWALTFWSQNEKGGEGPELLQEVLAQSSAEDIYRLESWIELLQSVASKHENVILEGNEDGIEVNQLMSGNSSEVTHRIFLGLVEEDFKTKSLPLFNAKDRSLFLQDLGFQLDQPEKNFRQFQLEWLLECPMVEEVLSVGLTHFDGNLLSPLTSWFQRHQKQSEPLQVETPLLTRWDELQRQDLFSVLQNERGFVPEDGNRLIRTLSWDLGDEVETSTLKTPLKFRLSPSALMSYLDCPFKFKSQKIYRLENSPQVDLELDPRVRGNFIHSLFEKILKEKALNEWKEEEILRLIDQCRNEEGTAYFENAFWPATRKKYLSLAQRFLQQEKEWRQRFPNSKVSGLEVSWKFYFDLEKREFSLKVPDSERYYEWNGKIDRVDGFGQQWVVLDYKSSSAQSSSFSQWIEDNQLQLLFYLWVIEKGFLPSIQGEVVGAFYYVFRNFQRDRGLHLSTAPDFLLPTEIRRSSRAEPEEKARILQEFEDRLKQVIESLADQKFLIQPRDLKLCPQCDWKKLCRAPHLN